MLYPKQFEFWIMFHNNTNENPALSGLIKNLLYKISVNLLRVCLANKLTL